MRNREQERGGEFDVELISRSGSKASNCAYFGKAMDPLKSSEVYKFKELTIRFSSRFSSTGSSSLSTPIWLSESSSPLHSGLIPSISLTFSLSSCVPNENLIREAAGLK